MAKSNFGFKRPKGTTEGFYFSDLLDQKVIWDLAGCIASIIFYLVLPSVILATALLFLVKTCG